VLTAPILSFAGAMIINKTTRNPYASALFVDWTLSPDSQNMITEILRGPLTIKHPFLPDTVKLVTYNIVSDDVTKRLHEAWTQYIGRAK
jgi:ABC-type Fe3+ transport system substrate-binding protein